MSFSKFFRKKCPDPPPPQILPQKMKAALSLDGIKDYSKSPEPAKNSLPFLENRLDDISVHAAASKYSKHLNRRSQLSKSLLETINDKDALAYFIQFLESKGRSNLVKFWLDVHTFHDWTVDMGQSTEGSNPLPPPMAADSTHFPGDTNGKAFVQNKDPSMPCQCILNCDQAVNGNKHHQDIGGSEDSIWEDMANDAILIFGKYFSPESRLCLDPPDELRDSIARRVCRCQDDQLEGLSCFDECQVWALNILEKEYYHLYLQSSYHCKHQLDILTGNFLTIVDVINHETSLSYFTEFMEQCRCIDYLQCFLDVDNFQRHFSDDQAHHYDPQVAQGDAMIIYDKFFSLQALRPLNLSDGVRLEVEGAICREGGVMPDCFFLPRSLLLYKMEQDHLPKFLKSDLYYKYLVDLINTVHASKDIPAYHRKRTGSDASSEKSFETISSNSVGSRNTLLAVDTLSKNSRKSVKAKENMQIDGSLLDPNNLWHRPITSMKLGHINSLGQFIPEFEPEPDHEKKKKFGFSLFSNKNSKSEEDMAIQIAQQVIQDVNIITNYASAGDDEEDDIVLR